ncbi:MAG TPA: hypothetical protein PKW95_09050 [bacterium]|nr:hypothetical protein [bacterium]
MEALQAVLAKVQNHQVIITLFWLFLLTVLTALIVLRQRRVKRLENLIGAHFANIRNKLEETEARQKKTLGDGIADLKKQTDTVLSFQEQATKNTGHITAKLEEIGNTTREMIYDLQATVTEKSSGADMERLVVNLREKVEELTDELAWTNNWFEDMRALETAVINLVGPAKMRKLIDKERSIAQAAGEELIKKSGL